MTPTASICACHRVALERLAGDRGGNVRWSLRVVAVSAGLTIIDTGRSQHEKAETLDR
jgi:hypothetical protein